MGDEYTLRKDVDRLLLEVFGSDSDDSDVVKFREDSMLKQAIRTGEHSDFGTIDAILEFRGLLDNITVIDLIYPIGSVYMTVRDIDPSELFGGVWNVLESDFEDIYLYERVE